MMDSHFEFMISVTAAVGWWSHLIIQDLLQAHGILKSKVHNLIREMSVADS